MAWFSGQEGQDNRLHDKARDRVRCGVYKGNIIASKYGIVYGAGLIVMDKEGIVQKKVPRGFTEDELIGAIEGVLKKKPSVQKGQGGQGGKKGKKFKKVK